MVLQANGIILQNLSSTDNLTGLLNRNGFQEHLTKYMKKHSNEHCVCIALDIDDFKFINDLFVHIRIKFQTFMFAFNFYVI